MNNLLTSILFVSLAMAVPRVAWGMSPVLLFSDITSGPKTGLTDDVVTNQGAIVTVWGVNLGLSQGSSEIKVNGAPAAHIYYWCNADAKSGGGPADLYTYNKMQEIAFAIPSTVSEGKVKIIVTVDGKESNGLDFTIRPGNIFFIKSGGGNKAGDGSWSNPWGTIDYYGTPPGASKQTKLGAGDIIYVCNVTENNRVNIKDKKGTVAAPIALISYPGQYYRIRSDKGGIKNYVNSSEYWVFSKIDVRAETTGIGAFKGMRVVGCEISDTICADGQSGAISGSGAQAGDGIKVLGNYIHDYGCRTSSKLHHVIYLSNRSGKPIKAYELGWNYLSDNEVRHALHIYDEKACGNYTGTFKIHDNVVVNQRGAAFNANGSGGKDQKGCISAPIDVYNNLFVNCGLEPFTNYTINVTMSGMRSHIRFYNNAIYGYSADAARGGAIYVQANGKPNWNFGGTWEWVNNIVVDTHDRAYEHPSYHSIPKVSNNNIWYNGGDGKPPSPPAWDSSPITSDPKFLNVRGTDFRIAECSPAVDAGSSDVSGIVQHDLYGTIRPINLKYDIGPHEFDKVP